MTSDITQDTTKSITECKEQGLDPAEFYWPFNGMKPDGSPFGMDMAQFVSFAIALHPEYLDEETGAPLLYDFVFTQSDEEILGIPGLAGTVMVTILPSLDGNTNYALSARRAALRYPANPKITERLTKLSDLFTEKGM